MTKNSDRSTIILTALITGICLLADSMFYIALPLYFKEAGLSSLIEAGILLSINRFIRIPLNPFAAFLIKSLKLQHTLLLAIFLTILTNIGFFSLNGFLCWFVLRCIWGFAWALLRLSGQLLVVQLSSRSNKGKIMGIFNGTYRLGSLAGMIFGGLLCYQIGMKQTCLVFAAACLLSVPLVFLLTIPSVSQLTKGKADNGEVTVFKKNSVRLSLIRGFIAAFLLQGVFASIVSYYLSRHYGMHVTLADGAVVASGAASGLLLGLRWIWEPFLAPLIGHVSDGKLGRHPLLFLALLLTGFLFPLINYQVSFFIWALIIVLLLICSTIITTLTDALFSDAASGIKQKTAIITKYSIATDLGAALGPLSAYLLIETGTAFLTFCSGLSLFLAWISIKEYRKSAEDAEYRLKEKHTA
ncbi:MFS transporter [Metabacillus sp. JX24]|uniref:MFS transporter n=1 Tax=Metabacillus sp. JX24 TaxID=3240759 RepID=UPI00350FF416